MGCIRVDKITEYLCEPLRKCLKDEDPYVRKTAAVCVAKLHDINAQLVEDQGFLDLLRELLSDSNPMVRHYFTCSKFSTYVFWGEDSLISGLVNLKRKTKPTLQRVLTLLVFIRFSDSLNVVFRLGLKAL